MKASLDEVESMEGLLELDDTMKVMIISDENEMGQVCAMTLIGQVFVSGCSFQFFNGFQQCSRMICPRKE